MSGENQTLGFASFFVLALITFVLLVFPVWKTFVRAGKSGALSLFLLVPFPIGLWTVFAILALSEWPTFSSSSPDKSDDSS